MRLERVVRVRKIGQFEGHSGLLSQLFAS